MTVRTFGTDLTARHPTHIALDNVALKHHKKVAGVIRALGRS